MLILNSLHTLPHTIHPSPFNHIVPHPHRLSRRAANVRQAKFPTFPRPFTFDGTGPYSVRETRRDVRHSYKSRETRRASAGWLMHQTRIMAPPNLLRRGDSPIKYLHNLPPHFHVVFVTYCNPHHFHTVQPAFHLGLLSPNFRLGCHTFTLFAHELSLS